MVIKHRQEEGSHTFPGGKIRVGDYKICFDNKFSVLSSKLVLFSVSVDKEEENSGLRAKETKVQDEISQQLHNIRQKVISAAGLQYKMLVWHGKDRSLADRKVRRVDSLSFVMITLIILASLLQAFMVKKLFHIKY